MPERTPDEIKTDLYYRRLTIGNLRIEAQSYEIKAARMRTIAVQLTNAVQPLRTAFNPIRSLHTAQTWEGQAATASRRRLDEHEIRHNTAIRSIDGLITDLEVEAARVEQMRSSTLGEIDAVSWQITRLEREADALAVAG